VNFTPRISAGFEQRQGEAAVTLRALPAELLSLLEQPDPIRGTTGPTGLHRISEAAVRRLIEFPAGTPALRILVDKAAEPWRACRTR
jgi:hypothetical protein